MIGLELLGVAIGMTFVYLLLSLVCTAVYELIESVLKQRATDLERGIRELLGPPQQNRDRVQELYEHPLIYGLYRGTYDPTQRKNLPSYIPARNFALALMDLILPATSTISSGATGATPPKEVGSSSPSTPPPLAAFREAVGNIENSRVKHALLPLIDAAGNDIGQARANIEAWYNSGMDRVSGWYKRRAQRVIFGLGFALAIVTNADTFAILQNLTTDAQLRASVVAASEEYIATTQLPPTSSVVRSSPMPDLSSAAPVPITCQQDQNTPDCRIDKNINRLRALGLPIGWDSTNRRSVPTRADGLLAWPVKAGGWLVTAFAISLGAPFWFDLLNKFLVIRSTVKPTEKSPEEKSED